MFPATQVFLAEVVAIVLTDAPDGTVIDLALSL
jgi:hypothetical protein